MDKQSFARVVDESLHNLRWTLLDAFPEVAGSGTNSLQLESASPTNFPTNFSHLTTPTVKDSPSPSRRQSLAPTISPVDSIQSLQRIEQEEMDTPRHRHPELVPAFQGSEEEGRKIRSRLRLRLGALNDSLVSGKGLHDACGALGLTAYTVEDMNSLVNLLADYIELDFEREEGVVYEKPRRLSVNSANMFFFSNHHQPAVPVVSGTPVWHWPSSLTSRNLHRSASMQQSFDPFAGVKKQFNLVPAMPLMEIFLAKECEVHRRIFGQKYMKQFKAMKEILLAGDTNRLVAELTFVRINDLAAPPEDRSIGVLLEPLVAFVIIANGVVVGFQADPEYANWHGWLGVESAFAFFLIAEILLRMFVIQGRRTFFCGQECAWNFFDLLLAASGLADVCIQLAGADMPDVFATSLLRFCRLIRLVRIVKVFRLKAMKDLRLMVKGLVAGVKTLVLAFTLLFTVLYVISGFATMTIGGSQKTIDLGLQRYFLTIPDSMFTCFRCFTGECVNDSGQPIHAMLADAFGPIFVFPYVASFMLVSLGIFNVILAVYVDITMKAAKENDLTVEQHSRESIRIARIARELLKKFAAAFRLFQDMNEEGNSASPKINISKSNGFMDADVLESIAITKELFLMVIQDRRVQGLMDELELPPDRANLFEIIDADGSGTLQLSELVHGLLKIRGEISKSDVVAGLLATKAVQEKVDEVLQENARNLNELKFELQGLQLAMRSRSREPSRFTDTEPLEEVSHLEEEESPRLPSITKPSFLLQAPQRPEELVDDSEVAPPEAEPVADASSENVRIDLQQTE
eukprot:s2767_g9.t1